MARKEILGFARSKPVPHVDDAEDLICGPCVAVQEVDGFVTAVVEDEADGLPPEVAEPPPGTTQT